MYLVQNVLNLILLCSLCDAARILGFFPIPSISHQVVFRSVTHELAKRGHDVVVVTPDPAYPKGEAPGNLTEIDVHDRSYKLWRDLLFTSETISGKNSDVITQITDIMPLLSQIFEVQIQTEEVQEILNNKTNHFDLIIAEASVRCTSALSHVFKAPVVYISSFLGLKESYDIMGAPSYPPLFYPIYYRQRIYNLTLREKLRELYIHFVYERTFAAIERYDDKMVKRLFGPDTPSTHETENNVHLLLLNVHPIWEMNRPVPPNVIYMGGVHQKPQKELPQDLKTYLDSSKNGVIYVSYGTNIELSTLPPEKLQILVSAFSKQPYDVLWRVNATELPGRTPNIRLSKWLPQSDLLRHPKIKLFIMQGGLQSTDEAITAGVPLIGMPMLGDQWYNNEQFVYHKIGIRLDVETLTEKALLESISTVINDVSYRKNIEKLRSIMQDQPTKPLERAVFWVEHLIRHGGGTHLRARVANMTWSEYLDLELMAVFALAVIIVLILISVALYTLVGYVKRFLAPSSKLKSS